MTMNTDSIHAVLRLRTLGPSGLNPPQTEVIDRLRTLAEDGPIADLDVDVWGPSMGITQTTDRDPEDVRETVAEFRRWATEQGCTLRPAFDWRSAEFEDGREGSDGRIVTPLITLAVYDEGHLRAVYPHVDGDDVRTIHDGVEALESMAGDDERSEDDQRERRAVPIQ